MKFIFKIFWKNDEVETGITYADTSIDAVFNFIDEEDLENLHSVILVEEESNIVRVFSNTEIKEYFS